MGGINTKRRTAKSAPSINSKPLRCRRKFLRFFPGGFRDNTYIDWERGYKWQAHQEWEQALSQKTWRLLRRAGRHAEVAKYAVRIESRTNLLFSFEKMALRDAVKTPSGAKLFDNGLYDFIYGKGALPSRFKRWCEAVANLPRRQTRVLTWPVLTVFPFIAQPQKHIFLKPLVTMNAADAYGFPFEYRSRPNWGTYSSLLEFAGKVRLDQRDLRPKDMIDLQSFIWVQGSDEYE